MSNRTPRPHGARWPSTDGPPKLGERFPLGGARRDGLSIEVDRSEKESIRVLVVDDEETLRESCASLLRAEGFPVQVAGDGEKAVHLLRHRAPDILLVDLYMPGVTGLDVLEAALEVNPGCLVIVMTGKPSVESSVEALRAGAWNYLPKPFSAIHFNILLGRAAHAIVVARESERNREETAGEDGLTILGESESFRKVMEAAGQVAPTDASVFIYGESGTGKELIAQFIHRNSRRSSRSLVPINSAAIPENLLESEMFGHVEGAFTGAVRDKRGLLETANGGTLFLDEISDMPQPVQAKLLRVIQDGVVRRVGSTQVDAVVDVRFIAATNIDPAEAVRKGDLRRDLHYRLRVFPIRLPPLRERPEDVPVLARHYLARFWKDHRGPDLPRPELTEEALEALQRHPWPGNVRELRNVMEHAVVILEPEARVRPEQIPFLDEGGEGPLDGDGALHGLFRLHQEYHDAREHVLGRFEQSYLRHVVTRTGGKLSEAARVAGVDRTTLYRLMDKHGLRKEDILADRYRDGGR